MEMKRMDAIGSDGSLKRKFIGNLKERTEKL